MQLAAQLKAQELQLKAQLEAQLEEVKHGFNKEIEMIKAEAYSTRVTTEKDFKAAIETMKDDRKDERVKKQAVEQSKLISQRDGKRGELTDESAPGDVTSEILG
jgi:predicted acetyltransferase